MNDLGQKFQDKWQAEGEARQHEAEHTEVLIGLDRVQRAVLQGHQAQIAALAAHEPRVEVKNPVESVKTPDVAKVVTAIESLIQVEKARKTDLSPVVKELKALVPVLKALPKQITMPEPLESVEVRNLAAIEKTLGQILEVMKADIERDAMPITVQAPDVIVNEKEQDFTPLVKAQQETVKAIKAIKMPEIPPDDDTAVLEALNSVDEAIRSLRFPVPNVPTDPLIRYRVADIDNGTVKYAGMVASDGAWVIEKVDNTANPVTVRYAYGTNAYPANWAARASLTYGYMYIALNG